jgi:hypothetical protein
MSESQEIQALLRADGEALRRAARLPAAQTMLWRAKVRSARAQRRRAARLVALAQGACTAMATLGLLAWTLENRLATGGQNPALTWLLAGLGAALAALSWLIVRESRLGTG